MSFAGSGPQAGAPYVAAPYMPDYNAQSRGYGSVPAMPYAAMLPYGMSPIPAPQPYHAGLPADSNYDADATALAQGLDSNLVLSPQQPHMMPPMPGAPPQYYGQQRGGQGGYAGGPNAPPQYYGPPSGAHSHHGGRGQQQQMGMQPHMRQPSGGMGPAAGGPGHQHHHMGMNGHPPGFRGDMGGPGPNGHGPRSSSSNSNNRGGRGAGYGMPQDPRQPQPPQQQRRKKVQRGLEDNVRRTVYISYIDQQVRLSPAAAEPAAHGTSAL